MVSGPGPGPGAARSKAYMERRNIDATLSGHKWNMDRGRGGGRGPDTTSIAYACSNISTTCNKYKYGLCIL